MIARIALAAALFPAAVPAAAQQHWTLLGRSEIGRGDERHVLAVEGAGRFSQLRLCVTRQAVHFYNVKVRFRSGAERYVLIGSTLPNYRCTPDISLAGLDRDISEIAFTYRASGIRRRGARVRVDAR